MQDNAASCITAQHEATFPRAAHWLLIIVVVAVCVRAQRMLLWQMRDELVAPFNESVQQVYARISALRDSLDGPQVGPHAWHYPVETLNLQS